jgi:hypothetical protein
MEQKIIEIIEKIITVVGFIEQHPLLTMLTASLITGLLSLIFWKPLSSIFRKTLKKLKKVPSDIKILKSSSPVNSDEPYNPEELKNHRIIPKSCNRSDQLREFYNFFRHQCIRSPFYPQFYILYGSCDENHISFIERVRDEIINKYKISGSEGVGYYYQCIDDWPFSGNLEARCYALKESIIYFTDRNSDFPEYNIENLCSCRSFEGYDRILLAHNIDAEEWDKNSKKLIKWYKDQFFGEFIKEGKPLAEKQFLIFLNIIFDTRVSDSRISKIEKELKSVQGSVSECKCKIIPKLERIKEFHMRNLVNQIKGRIDINSEEKNRLLKPFKNGRRICMESVEDMLEDICREKNLIKPRIP